MNRLSFAVVLLLTSFLALTSGCARKPDDAKISSDVQSKFSQDSGLSTKQITAQASNGVVTLAGYVDNDTERQAAARQAASVAGVREVVNNLEVGSASNAPVPAAATGRDASPERPPARKSRHANGSRSEAAGNDNASSPVANNSQPAPPAPHDTPAPSPSPALPQVHKVTIEQGTPVSIRLIDSIDSEKSQVGETFHATLNAPLAAEGSEALPAGTDVAGHIVEIKSSGKFKGSSLVVLQLDSISSNGHTYEIQTDQYRKEGGSRGKNTAEKVGGGAIIGGIIGAIAGGGKGAAIGSAAGAGVGGGVQAATKAQAIKLPSETVLNFTLQAPVTVIRQQDPNANRQKLSDSQ
jgi:hypothetical protein